MGMVSRAMNHQLAVLTSLASESLEPVVSPCDFRILRLQLRLHALCRRRRSHRGKGGQRFTLVGLLRDWARASSDGCVHGQGHNSPAVKEGHSPKVRARYLLSHCSENH